MVTLAQSSGHTERRPVLARPVRGDDGVVCGDCGVEVDVVREGNLDDAVHAVGSVSHDPGPQGLVSARRRAWPRPGRPPRCRRDAAQFGPTLRTAPARELCSERAPRRRVRHARAWCRRSPGEAALFGHQSRRHQEAHRPVRSRHAVFARCSAQRRLGRHRKRRGKVWTSVGSVSESGSTVPSRIARSGLPLQLTVVPAEQAVESPGGSQRRSRACLGIPGITAHRAVFGDGPVTGTTGARAWRTRRRGLARCTARALGRCGGHRNCAASRRHRGGRPGRGHARGRAGRARPCGPVRAYAPDGVDRVIEVAFGQRRPRRRSRRKQCRHRRVRDARGPAGVSVPPLLWANVTIRLLGSDDFPVAAKREAASALHGSARRRAVDTHWRTAAPRTDSRSARPRRRWRARACAHLAPVAARLWARWR